MRSAVVLMLAMAVGLALLSRSVLNPRSAEDRPQTSPPVQAEPKLDAPTVTENYEEAMKESDRRVILVFGAEWCPHYVVLKENLKDMNLDGCLVCLIDVDKSKDLKKEYRVRSLPTSVMLEDGKESSRKVGFDKAAYEIWIGENR